MARHRQNSGGVWDAGNAKATYKTTPDKESPLWNAHSQVIYWWTATEVDEEHAYMIVYDGKVWPRAKQFSPAYLGFRCVRQPPIQSEGQIQISAQYFAVEKEQRAEGLTSLRSVQRFYVEAATLPSTARWVRKA
jgi:hypothetical protein